MEENEVIFTETLYSEHLKTINGISFTHREIDVIACLLNARGTSKIASFLSIAPRTVVTHIRNIMLKVECNSRESIIDFVERSHKLFTLRKYYTCLIIEAAFEKTLQEISKLKREESPTCVIIYWENQNLKNSLIGRLTNHLKQANLKVEILEKTIDQRLEDIENLEHTLLLLFEKKDQQEVSETLSSFDFVDLLEQKNYYFSVFEILKKLLPNSNLEDSLINFRKHTKELQTFSEEKEYTPNREKQEFSKHEDRALHKFKEIFIQRKWYFLFSCFIIGIVSVVLIGFKPRKESALNLSRIYNESKKTKEEPSIRSDLPLPTTSTLLSRPEIIAQIDEGFKGEPGIQTVALVGPGGAGKTTLARQYAHQQKAQVVWEINAETSGSLINSFESLGYVLCQNEEEKKILKELQLIAKPVEKEEKIIFFVKERLKLYPNWCLIFDNVEKFSEIQKYFPRDIETWGRGNVIVTTRDSTIQNNKYINHVLKVGELDLKQKFNLFTNIMEIGDIQSLDSGKLGEVKKFLIEIPSFPLDVSIAAYYLKATSIPYHDYLKNLQKNLKDFTDIQEEILKESGDYFNTRYKIITLALQQLIDTHKDFGALLLFISLLDSQNIPKDLLRKYKNDIVVDSFIYHLKKYSLITNESINSFVPSISIHRSTQAISLNYLTNHLKLEQNDQIIKAISYALDGYLANAIDEDDLLKMKNHCEVFLNHSHLLTDATLSTARTGLGAIYFYLGNYKKTKFYLERNITNINTEDKTNHSILARSLGYLGTTHRILGDYEKAREFLEKSLAIYRTYLPENHVRVAWILSQIGIVYRDLGDYEIAQNFIRQGLILYRQYLPEGHTKLAWALATLATVHIEEGSYKEAQEMLENSLSVYRKSCSDSHIRVAWVLAHLGIVHHELGDHAKAKELLEQSLIVYQKYFFDNHIELVRALRHLGNVYKDLGSYEKAKQCLQKSLETCETNYGKDHIDIALCLLGLADIYTAEDKPDLAEDSIRKASLILKQNKHPVFYIALEKQADFCIKKALGATKNGNNEQSKRLTKQAIDYLEQASKIVETCYPKQSPFQQKIHSKIRKLKSSLDI
ncbi:MAG: tetratricopeptide repeat protein [Alphaproteobacteria bacterium]|nr:tetratricopeptide repeat protein [Alphaproteobacteria bacterium]